MRKKLDTRFPAARIKKIMQADEDVGKIALAVPVLVSKSLELFLQDLCDRTYEITLERGAKTVSSLHLKNCVERYNVFDFLREVVSKVPDYGHTQGQGPGHGDVTMEDRSISKRRKPISDEVNDSDEEAKKIRTQEMGNAKPSGRGVRGRGRGRGRGGRVARAAERDNLNREIDLETTMVDQPPPQDSNQMNVSVSSPQENDKENETNQDTKQQLQSPKEGIDFDLNAESLDLNEAKLAPASTAVATAVASEEYPEWPLMEMGKMNPAQLASLGKRIDEEEEDYDEED
ncbi:unnamed protein product [Cochlearia groenlandica]